MPVQRAVVQELTGLPAEDRPQRGLLGPVQRLPAVLDAHGALVANVLAHVRTNTKQVRHLCLLNNIISRFVVAIASQDYQSLLIQC